MKFTSTRSPFSYGLISLALIALGTLHCSDDGSTGSSDGSENWNFTQSAPSGQILFLSDPSDAEANFRVFISMYSSDHILGFTSRPGRESHLIPSSEFEKFWTEEGKHSFKEDPPSAVLHFNMNGGDRFYDQAVVLNTAKYLYAKDEMHAMIYEASQDGFQTLRELWEAVKDNDDCKEEANIATSNSYTPKTLRSCPMEDPSLFIDSFSLSHLIGERVREVSEDAHDIGHLATHIWKDVKKQLKDNVCVIPVMSAIMVLAAANPEIDGVFALAAASGIQAITPTLTVTLCAALGSDIHNSGIPNADHLNVTTFRRVCGTTIRSSSTTRLPSELAHLAATAICHQPLSR